ncbi:transglycosylase domain-containing protein [Modestobacter sp. Leaf380]|uniref:transglycosylase domain-containing protein n=1 Tax=Modestobacter sp. Leaf380 TaxID=1736356 RepID=UPI0009E9CF85|nr:transglycosylase domain-containing protein [Modestobacter sp. Leaf380]
MTERRRTTLGTLTRLAASVVVAGALTAGMLLPVVGATGLAARESASLLEALPVELTDQTPHGNTTVLAADGSVITQFYEENRTPVTAEQIPDVVRQALIAIEDNRFYEHGGVDAQGTLRALATNLAAGGVVEGGSTLTQQLVKQTLLQTADTPEEAAAATEESVGRKLVEARLALALEETYSKEEILTRYLNIAYFGAGAYGIQAAAQRYFSVDAAALTLPQAATLTGLMRSPAVDSPLASPENAQARRDQVLQRMTDLGTISEQQRVEATSAPVVTVPSQNPPNGCIDASVGGFFCAYLLQHLTEELGMTQQQLDDGGYTIQTTLRPDVQTAGDRAVVESVPMGDSLAGMFTAVQPGTGHVLAMAVNRTYGCDAAVDASCESVVLNDAASQGSGSTYKVFTAAAALARGFSPQHTITTTDPYVSQVFRDGSGRYDVGNAGSYPDTLTMADALVFSSNTYFLALEDALGSVEGPVAAAEAMGMDFDRPNQTSAQQIVAEDRGSFTFGAEPTSPLDLAGAYATLAARGTQCDPTPVVSVVDREGVPATLLDGTPVDTGPRCVEGALSPAVADTLTEVLRRDVEPGNPGQTGARAYVPGHQIAGKTGTSQNALSATFVGYTPEYAASVMVLNPKENEDVGGYGGNRPAVIWNDALTPVLEAAPVAPFPAAGAAGR